MAHSSTSSRTGPARAAGCSRRRELLRGGVDSLALESRRGAGLLSLRLAPRDGHAASGRQVQRLSTISVSFEPFRSIAELMTAGRMRNFRTDVWIRWESASRKLVLGTAPERTTAKAGKCAHGTGGGIEQLPLTCMLVVEEEPAADRRPRDPVEVTCGREDPSWLRVGTIYHEDFVGRRETACRVGEASTRG